MVGVSTHVLRSWERRLSLDVNHRTRSNQRRYWIEDVQRFIVIRQLHERGGLPLVESAAQSLTATRKPEPRMPGIGQDDIDGYWAGLLDTFPEVLLLIDDAGKITAANDAARRTLSVRIGSSFLRLAPHGWRETYHALRRTRGRASHTVLAMRSRTDIVFVDASVEPVGTRPDGPLVLIGRPLHDQAPSAPPQEAGLSG
jgi:PAS domain-containing protein